MKESIILYQNLQIIFRHQYHFFTWQVTYIIWLICWICSDMAKLDIYIFFYLRPYTLIRFRFKWNTLYNSTWDLANFYNICEELMEKKCHLLSYVIGIAFVPLSNKNYGYYFVPRVFHLEKCFSIWQFFGYFQLNFFVLFSLLNWHFLR